MQIKKDHLVSLARFAQDAIDDKREYMTCYATKYTEGDLEKFEAEATAVCQLLDLMERLVK